VRLNITCVLVSHDAEDILSWADEIMVMKNGQIIEQGNPKKIYHHPASEYTAGLFGKYNLLPASILQKPNTTGNKKVFLRPGQFQISATKGITEGVITAIHFLGDWYETEINVSGSMITVSSAQHAFPVGSTIWISVDEQNLWYL